MRSRAPQVAFPLAEIVQARVRPKRPGVAAHAAQRIRCQYLSNGKRVVSNVDPDGARDECRWDIFWPGEILEPDRVPAMEFSALC